MANAEPGLLGAGCIQPCCVQVDGKGEIRIYSCASRSEHGILSSGGGGMVLHTLRHDGFTYLEPSGGTGVVGTRPLLWAGGILELNTLAPAGEVRVQVTDSKGTVLRGYSFAESIPFTGDSIAWTPRWNRDFSASQLPRQALRIEVQLNNARLYSIRGNIQVLTAAETAQIEQGDAPIL